VSAPGLPRRWATRYVAPLREGGSLPGLVEADDLGTYVVKFTGAGQGPKALVAEIVSGELGRRLGLAVPQQALIDLPADIARHEPDPEVQHLLSASTGTNLAVDFLPGSIGYDGASFGVDAATAAAVVWFDALVGNDDRSWRNPNLLVWGRRLWCIDHGATLTFHHRWSGPATVPDRPYLLGDHALAGVPGLAEALPAADAVLAPRVTRAVLEEVLALVPDEWLAVDAWSDDPDQLRAAYVAHLSARVGARRAWAPGIAA
jgi:hypothetical protein